MRDIDSIPNPHEREPEEPRTGTRHEQAVVDVGKSLYPYNDPLDAEGIVIEILSDEDGDIYEVINYAVAQRERVLELEQENAELRQVLKKAEIGLCNCMPSLGYDMTTLHDIRAILGGQHK